MARIGYDPNDSDEQRLQKTLLSLGSWMFTAAGAFWGILYFLLDEYIASSIPLGYTVISLLSIIIFHFKRRYKFLLFTQLLLILFLPFLLMIALGGFIKSSTVNTASRMQSHSLPGQIQISQVTYELIKSDFVCEPRGKIQVKGKGEMDIWLVVSAKE